MLVPNRRFKRWVLTDPTTVVPLFTGDQRRGIYILEFADGYRYVGQASNVVNRYSQHRHGSGQHSPWEDIVAIQFLSVPRGDLDSIERATIREQGIKFELRNRAHNFGHWEPTALDEFVEPELQAHWATGQPDYSQEAFAKAASAPAGELPKLLKSQRGQEVLPDGRRVWEAVVDELAQVVALAIPNAVETEGQFWMISDYPNTAGGRFATLNVGSLELAYFPRRRFEPGQGNLDASSGLVSRINADIETFIHLSDIEDTYSTDDWLHSDEEIDGHAVGFSRLPDYYSVPVDAIQMPLGIFGVQKFFPEELAGVRNLAIHSMRRGSARVNSRGRGEELIRLVYKRIADPGFLEDYPTNP